MDIVLSKEKIMKPFSLFLVKEISASLEKEIFL